MDIDIVIEGPCDWGEQYFLSLIADVWRNERKVRIRLAEKTVEAAPIGIPHVDRTVRPAAVEAALKAYIICVNREIPDISKRVVSRNLLEPNSDWVGPVIVKSNANAGGIPDNQRNGGNSATDKRMRRLSRMIPWRWRGRHSLRYYRILSSLRVVPDWVWKKPDIVVEKFLPELENDLYVTRSWVVLGDRDYVQIVRGNTPILKADNYSSLEVSDFVPDELRALQTSMKFDYAKIDWVQSDGVPVVLDVNTTPGIGMITERHREIARLLAPGIESLIKANAA